MVSALSSFSLLFLICSQTLHIFSLMLRYQNSYLNLTNSFLKPVISSLKVFQTLYSYLSIQFVQRPWILWNYFTNFLYGITQHVSNLWLLLQDQQTNGLLVLQEKEMHISEHLCLFFMHLGSQCIQSYIQNYTSNTQSILFSELDNNKQLPNHYNNKLISQVNLILKLNMIVQNAKEAEMVPNSSTNLIINSPKALDSAFSRAQTFGSSYPMGFKQIRVGMKQEQSALPHSFVGFQFLHLFPFIIFSVLKQLHVIYLIVVSGFLMFKYCDAEWEIFSTQLLLSFGYICIEIVGRYFTFKFYVRKNEYNGAIYSIWNNDSKFWEPIEESNIKVGQILKIKKKQSSIEQSQQLDDQTKIRIPVNLLPMMVGSAQKEVSIQTFEMNKQEASKKISLIKNFQNYFIGSDTSYVRPKICDECVIHYTFSNPISQSFQGNITFLSDFSEKNISNIDAIPRGAYMINEQQLVGVVLFNLEQKNIKHLKHILGRKNSIATLLQKHLIVIILFNFLIALLLIGLNAILTTIEVKATFPNQYYCYFFNYFSLLSFSMNVIMYMILGFHQIIDSFLIRSKCNVHMNNWIKSIDQFGMADTFVMDQFSFVKKNILQVSSVQVNQNTLTTLDEEIILITAEKSKYFQTKFHSQWLSLTHYYQSNYILKGNLKRKELVDIKGQKIDNSGSIIIIFTMYDQQKDSSEEFIVRFNQKIIFSILQSMALEKQLFFSEKIQQGKQNGELMLMVEVYEVKEGQKIDIGDSMYEYQFKFFLLIKLKFLPHQKAVDFLRYLINKYKIMIMASSSIDYFENMLVCSDLKDQKDTLITFEQTEQKEFEKDLTQKLESFKKKFSKGQRNESVTPPKDSYLFSQQNFTSSEKSNNELKNTLGTIYRIQDKITEGNLLLAIDSSLIIYLGRPNIKQLLLQFSQFATYIIFYNCSQFQKQLCSASIFKIFPKHIFISNFAIDSNIFRISNLSVCISSHSASRYTTAMASSYQQLQKFISKECITSIQLTTIIIKTHIFKNQSLIWSFMLGNWLVFRAHHSLFELQYSTYIIYLYNACFTILPIFYYLIARPQLVGDIVVDDYKDYKLRYEHIKGIFSGILLTFVTYSLISQNDILMLFVAIMINCTFIGNFYHLVIDDSAKKHNQIWIIIIQCAISIGVYFVTLYVQDTYQLFLLNCGIYPDPNYELLFFGTVFVIIPLIIYIVLYFMSFHKSIITKDRRLERKQVKNLKFKHSLNKERIVGKISKSAGKQMRFR